MSTDDDEKVLNRLLNELQDCLENDSPISQQFYDDLQQHPEYGMVVLKRIPTLQENNIDEEKLLVIYLHFIELCLTLLRIASEHEQRWAIKVLEQYQSVLASLIKQYPQSSQWMSVVNIFYSADISLDENVKRVYLHTLQSTHQFEKEPLSQRQMLQQLLSEDSDSDEFDVAEMFFSQTSALPAEYFPAFVRELLEFELEKATNAAVLFLLHPDRTVRQLILGNLDELFQGFSLTSVSLTRLPLIRQWLPADEKAYIDPFYASQRKLGIEFSTFKKQKITEIKATEMDGSGSQAIFFVLKHRRQFQTAGVLVKREMGIKDAWLAEPSTQNTNKDFSLKAMYQNIALRKVDTEYAETLISHHIAEGLQLDKIPNIRLIQLSELCGFKLLPALFNFESSLEQLLKLVPELDEEFIKKSLKRSGKWHKTKSFTSAWIDETAELDKLVNSHCSFVQGTKFCNMSEARDDIINHYMETHRELWMHHFIWMTLWAKPHARHNEYLWKDTLVLAHVINQGMALNTIPIMQSMTELCILASIETMETRKTHLS